jgi:hypothetical protein
MRRVALWLCLGEKEKEGMRSGATFEIQTNVSSSIRKFEVQRYHIYFIKSEGEGERNNQGSQDVLGGSRNYFQDLSEVQDEN